MQIPFGEWLPDQPEHNNPGANVANNVYYALNSYKRFPSLVNYSTNTTTKDSRGAGSFRDNSNTVFNFVATQETIYELTGGAFSERGARGKVLSTAFATCTITVSDYANIGASKTITLKKNDGTTVVFTSVTGSPSTNEFQVQTNNDTTATNLKNTINGHADFSASVSGAVVTVTRATVGNNNLTNVSSDTVRLTTTNFYGGTPLTGDATDYVTFTQFGNYIIASNGVDAPQYYLMGTSSSFEDLSTIGTSGTVPTFKVSGIIRDFLVTGNHVGATNRIQWSGINDITTWAAGTKQSDLQDLPGSGGQIVHITSGEIGYVFRQNQIIRMDYVGGATVFRLSVISPNRGAVYGRTVCQDNRRVFFYADDGFFEVNGDQVTAIGAEKVNRFFDLDLNKAFSDRIVAATDPFNQLAIWLYPSSADTSNTTGICDKVLIYNYATQKWSTANANASTIFSQFVGAYTVELMDIISENLDNINISLDTDFWNGGQLLLGAIDSDYKAAIFSGTENEGEIETTELELFPGTRSSIIGVRPIVDATATVTLKTRDRLADIATESTSSSMNSTGINPVRQSGRYVKVNVKIPSGGAWKDAQGIDIVASRSGLR
jgi:hypothetical protein|tara:strand:+ start:1405 stop:3216 length:1812 start_codon:yes stop_codon:yes gene_type:complete